MRSLCIQATAELVPATRKRNEIDIIGKKQVDGNYGR
jgi:hypothetical protein